MDYMPAALLFALGLVVSVFALIVSDDRTGQYLVIAAPGATLADTINLTRAADGGFVGTSYFPNMIIAGSNRTDFRDKLRKAGAWLTVSVPNRSGCVAPILLEVTS